MFTKKNGLVLSLVAAISLLIGYGASSVTPVKASGGAQLGAYCGFGQQVVKEASEDMRNGNPVSIAATGMDNRTCLFILYK